MKILKILGTLFISLSCSFSTFACGGGWYESTYDNIYRIEFMLKDGALGETYHNHRTEFTGNAVEDNLKEWSKFFEGKYALDKISSWIYTEDDIVQISIINKELSGFSNAKKEAFIEYMIIAKKAETISTSYDPWQYYRDDEPTVDYGFINRLTKDIISKQKITKDDFLEERYTFQLIKLYYYGKRYDKAVSTYDAFYKNKNSESIMQYWGLDYKAGAQMQSGDTINANYNFLQVFDNYPGRRYKSYHSMVFSDEEQFSKTLEACSSDEDKAAFYFIRGVNKHSVVLEDLKSCFSHAPTSEYAKVLMANELVKMEHIFWKKDTNMGDYGNDVEDMPMTQLRSYVDDFIDFTEKATNKSNDQDFWNISLAYLHSLNEDYKKSDDILNKISNSSKNYSKQIKAINLLNYVHLHPKLTNAEQNELGEMWFDYNDGSALISKTKWGGDGNINSYLADYLEAYYKERDPLKSFLFSGLNFSNFKYEGEDKLDVDEVHELRISLSKIDKTALQKYGEKSFLAGGGSNDINDALMEVEATLLMRDPNTLPEAVAYFEQLESTLALETNPFNMEINDCIWGGWNDSFSCNHKPGNYTKLSLSKQLLKMKQLAEKEQSAMDYYLLGNAYYNMTYFGHAYGALSYYRSGSSYTGFDDCSKALEMYEEAIPLFEGNREMQAKALFMAAKCSQNLYFIDLNESSEYGYWGIDYDYENPKQSIIDYNQEISAAGYREQFETLRKEFSDTKFYQEIIDECSYFNLYVHY